MSDIKLTLSLPDVNLILDSLGQMPYVRVYELISKLQTQAQAQLRPQASGIGTDRDPVAYTNGHLTEDRHER